MIRSTTIRLCTYLNRAGLVYVNVSPDGAYKIAE
jgi:hypothetical protein